MPANLNDWYLDALGIVQYRSRAEGAVDLPFHVETPSQPVADDIPVVNRGMAFMPESSADQSEDAADVQTDKVLLDEVDASQSIAPFRFACWQSGADLLVVNALPPGHVPVLEERDLLHNILRAVGRLGEKEPKGDYIDWPHTPGDSADINGAKSMLGVFLDARIRKCGVLWVLLMGELPATLLMPSQGAYKSVLGKMEDLPGGARAIVTPSLQTLLTSPEAKRITWTALQKSLVPCD